MKATILILGSLLAIGCGTVTADPPADGSAGAPGSGGKLGADTGTGGQAGAEISTGGTGQASGGTGGIATGTGGIQATGGIGSGGNPGTGGTACGTSSQSLCNGSCVDITTTTNCGTCGNKCGSGQTCSNGSCVGGGSTGGTTGTGNGGSSGTGGSPPIACGQTASLLGGCPTGPSGMICEHCQWISGATVTPCTIASGSALCVPDCSACP